MKRCLLCNVVLGLAAKIHLFVAKMVIEVQLLVWCPIPPLLLHMHGWEVSDIRK